MKLDQLVIKLRQSLSILQKQDIKITNEILGLTTDQPIPVGDDCAAIPDGDSYLLLAAEGIWPVLLETDPWFAGWCAIMVNLSDIAAMGGRAIAVVDTIWAENHTKAVPILAGMKAASEAYNVPILGGHTNYRAAYNALSVAIVGRAHNLISSFNAQPGDLLVVAIDLRGNMHSQFPFWNAATQTDPITLQKNLQILPYLAETNLCDAGKDISMGGIIGTLLMLIEASKCGAVLDLDNLPRSLEIPLETWLLCFPSYGFLLSIRPENISKLKDQFTRQHINCAIVGKINPGSELVLNYNSQSTVFWDWQINNYILGF